MKQQEPWVDHTLVEPLMKRSKKHITDELHQIMITNLVAIALSGGRGEDTVVPDNHCI